MAPTYADPGLFDAPELAKVATKSSSILANFFLPLGVENFWFVYFNPNRPGRFFEIFEKFAKKIQLSISPQLRVPEERTIARLKGLILGFHFGQVSPCRRAPLLSKF